MDKNAVTWRGYWPAAPTPFGPDGPLDEQAWRRLLDLYVSLGVHGVLVNGSSGEWWAQSDEERRRVAEIAVETVDGRIPVVIGCTSFSADRVAALAEHARSAGASGVLSTPPPYAHPSQEEIARFYADVDAAIDLPMMVYNWPRGTAVEIEVATAVEIARLEHVVAFKNSTADMHLVIDYIEALGDRARIFASLISPRGLAVLRELGGDGYIDGGALGAPFAVPFFESLWRGDIDTARSAAKRYSTLTSSLIAPDFGGRFAAPSAQLKAAMRLLGQPGGEVRPPLMPVTDGPALDGIRAALTDAGLVG